MKKLNLTGRKYWWKCLLLFLAIIWTGIIFGGLYRQYNLLGRLEEKCSKDITKLGFSNVTLLQNMGFDMESLWCERTALLQYIKSQNAGEEVTQINLIHQDDSNPLSESTDSVDNPSEEIEDIAVFNNGSFDITENNSNIQDYVQEITDKEQTETQSQEEAAVSETEQPEEKTSKTVSKELENNLTILNTLKKNKDRSYLLKNFYIVDSSTSIDNSIFKVNKLLSLDMTLKQEKEPQILIYHTHGASEAFSDSKEGKKSESIIGVGEELANLLTEKYGYHVIHDETEYDRIDGSIDRNKAYNQSYAGVTKTLQKYPSIQVLIDLHRDGVGNKVHRVTTIDGKKTAQVMFFNGLSRNSKGDIAYLHNDNLQANLAFSLQMKMACMENYPDFAKPIYLKSYRYNLHLRERSLLIELGNENNTLQEAKNAMEPLAKMLHQVLADS